MDASCKIQRSIHDVRLTYKYVSRILGTYHNWGDYFWGKVNNCGENQLGIILMDVRAKLQWNAETAPNNIPQCLQ